MICPVNHCFHKKLANTIPPVGFRNRNKYVTNMTGLSILIRGNITNTYDLMTQFRHQTNLIKPMLMTFNISG